MAFNVSDIRYPLVMSDLPAVESIWEWDLGEPLRRAVVRVVSTDPDTMSVVLDGPPPFPQRVSIWDFLTNATPPPLKHR